MKISVRLGLGFGVVILLLIATGLFSLNRMGVLAELTTKLYDHPFQVSNAVLEVDRNIVRMHRSMKDVVLAQNQAELETAVQEVDVREEKVYESFEVITQRFLGDRKMYEEPLEAFQQWKPIRDEVIRLIQSGEMEAAAAITKGKGAKHIDQITEKMRALRNFAYSKAAEFIADAETTRTRTRQVSFSLLVVTTLIGIGAAFFISRSITTRVNKVVEVATRVMEGDLTVRVPDDDRRDEIGILMQSFRQMIESLQAQIREIVEGTNVLVSSASEILVSTTQLASGASETATSVTETTSTVEEVRQTTQVSSQKAGEVAERAKKTEQISQSGREAAEEAIGGMNHIRAQMEAIAEGIVRLSEQSQTIGQIISTVDDLAEQSNLLAVNAAIEAARAGEEGKGFAVVAEEIRNLAEQSKQATTQVRTILNDIQKATGTAVMAAEQGSKAVEAGMEQSSQTGEAIRALGDNVAEAAQAAIQIAASSQQQLAGMEQVAQAMENIKQASDQNAASTQQVETSARSLDELGQRLKELVARYQVA